MAISLLMVEENARALSAQALPPITPAEERGRGVAGCGPTTEHASSAVAYHVNLLSSPATAAAAFAAAALLPLPAASLWPAGSRVLEVGS